MEDSCEYCNELPVSIKSGEFLDYLSNCNFLQSICVHINVILRLVKIFRYMKAAAEGETVVINCSTLKTGKTLAFLSVEITKKETGELIAVGSHTKFIGQ
jgi:acyl-CoA thioesterase FadM